MNLNNGKINKQEYYRWTGKLNDELIYLNLSRKNDFKYKFKIYCQHCHKLIREYKLSNIFALKYNNIIKISTTANFYCKKCAGSLNSINGMPKRKQTCLNRFGVEFNFQSDDTKNKARKTKELKYGKDWKKIQASHMINYWKNNVRIHHNGDDPIVRAKMVETWKKTVAKKSPEEISKWRKAIITKTKSKIGTECLDNLSTALSLPILREQLISTYHVDGLIENKCIFEFFGNYWHANPLIYDSDDKISFHGKIKTANEVWLNDKSRLEKIQAVVNLPIIIIWEQNYINNKQILIEQIIDYFLKGKFENGKIYYF